VDKKEILEFLNANRTSHLATVEEGAPRVRAIGIVKADEDGILFQTWRDKDLGKQLEQNSEVEFCFNNYQERIQLRVRGRVEPVEDTTVTKKFLEQRPNFQKLVDEGRELVLYSLKNGLAHIWTFEKNFEPKDFVSL